MKENEKTITWKGKDYTLVCNLNVMKDIQKRFGSLEEYGKLTDGKDHEVDIEALLYGTMEMINEGIDIENENKKTARPFLTEKQVGRLITDVSLPEVTEKVQNTIIDSVNDDSKNA